MSSPTQATLEGIVVTHARLLLEERLTGRDSVSLTEADRLLSNAGFKRSGGEISRILRSMGFAKAGWAGIGYDRTPLYHRETTDARN